MFIPIKKYLIKETKRVLIQPNFLVKIVIIYKIIKLVLLDQQSIIQWSKSMKVHVIFPTHHVDKSLVK